MFLYNQCPQTETMFLDTILKIMAHLLIWRIKSLPKRKRINKRTWKVWGIIHKWRHPDLTQNWLTSRPFSVMLKCVIYLHLLNIVSQKFSLSHRGVFLYNLCINWDLDHENQKYLPPVAWLISVYLKLDKYCHFIVQTNHKW